MLEAIEKLLILQDRDRKILKVKEELAHVGPERTQLQARAAASQTTLESAKHKAKQIESDRKKLELDVDAKKQLIDKYSLQQFQTKKNEEYRALAHEIDGCKEAIGKLEDQQLELMEQGDHTAKDVAAAGAIALEMKKHSDKVLADLDARETKLRSELAELENNRGELAAVVEDAARNKYERLLKHKGDNVVVGIQHGVCGGCHMSLSRQTIVSCQAEQELVACTNCGRILYYTRDMDLAVAD